MIPMILAALLNQHDAVSGCANVFALQMSSASATDSQFDVFCCQAKVTAGRATV